MGVLRYACALAKAASDTGTDLEQAGKARYISENSRLPVVAGLVEEQTEQRLLRFVAEVGKVASLAFQSGAPVHVRSVTRAHIE
jgi:hypothetical protein